MLQDTARFKMDVEGGLRRTLHGEIKPSMAFPFPRCRPNFSGSPLLLCWEEKEDDDDSKEQNEMGRLIQVDNF